MQPVRADEVTALLPLSTLASHLLALLRNARSLPNFLHFALFLLSLEFVHFTHALILVHDHAIGYVCAAASLAISSMLERRRWLHLAAVQLDAAELTVGHAVYLGHPLHVYRLHCGHVRRDTPQKLFVELGVVFEQIATLEVLQLFYECVYFFGWSPIVD